MTEIILYAIVLVALAVPLGAYMARVYRAPLARWERRLFGEREQSWREYAMSVMVFNALGIVVVYAVQRLQAFLPWNPNALPAVDPRVAFNTAVSFGTNTNWQAYGGETTMSHLTQSVALGVQNFVSAACGMAVLVALVRGFTRRHADTIGNFWVDLTRSTVYILLPLSVILAIALAQQGVPQTLAGHDETMLVEQHAAQAVAVGPVASQVAIKQLGTNGGG
ncbi:MAG TPA: potassium-transporting ATPase subunit KdpA, partial [Kofleriaceae bacterium]|nr:potassium-transporting ATPase subunit KdpA [Kofleriaceae bacterium]